MAYKKIKDFPEYKKNPFPAAWFITPATHIMVMDKDEELNYMSMHIADTCKTSLGLKIIFYLACQRITNQEVLLPIEIVYSEVGAYKTPVPYYRAIGDLINAGVLARKTYEPNVFFINPLVISPVKSL